MKSSIRRLCKFGVLILLPMVAAAQGTTGSISGTVTDSQKAVVPGVTILVRQTETGAERTLVSDERGRYTVLNLSPGPYRITAELTGFRSVVRDQLTVAIGKDLLVDIEMGVGGVEEQVTVAGETSRVSLGSTTSGGVVTTQQIAELPLNGRSFMQLATLQPGVDHQPRHRAGLHRRIRIHAAGDRRCASRADRLSDGRHQHRRHLGQGAVEPLWRAARCGHRPGIQRADSRL